MSTTYVDLYVNQATDYVTLITLTDDNGALLDLTGYAIRAKFARHWSSTTKYNFTTEVASPASAGTFTLRLFVADTSQIKPGRYQYDVEIFYDFGGQSTVERVIEGVLYLEPSVTNEI